LDKEEDVGQLTRDGCELLLSEADDFEREAEALRESESFQQFLDERSRSMGRASLDEIEAELHHDLDHLAGTWSDEEAAEFDAALAEQRKIDPELWRRSDQS